MASAARSLVIGIAALALLTGCATPAVESRSASPSGTPPSAASPGTPAESPTPAASPAPTTSAAGWPQCADAMVVDSESPTTVSWGGTYEEQMAAADPRPGFEPARLLESDAVLCSVVYDHPVDGPGGGVGRFATAIVRDAAVLESARAWAEEQGYEPLEPGTDGPELVLRDGDRDRLSARMSIWTVGAPPYGQADQLAVYERRSGLELEASDVVVTHVTFESLSS